MVEKYMPSKFLNFFKPAVRIMPEVKQPDREVSFKEKMIWTLVALIIYLIMSNTPLYGVNLAGQEDYFYWLRVILASSRGTLTELGISPIVTAGLIMQLLVGSKIINVNMSDPVDRGLFTGAQKVMALLLTIFQGVAYLLGGAFGEPGTGEGQLAVGDMILIFMQLLAATVIIMLLDEMLQKGWGVGSGVSLFIAAGVAGQILWNSFSFVPTSTDNDGDGLYRGAIVAFFQSIFDPSQGVSVGETFIRANGAPGIFGVFTTIIIFVIVVYFEAMRIEIPLSYAGYSGFKGKYPMKLMYVSNIPVILAQALYANVLFFAQLLAGPNASFRLNHPNWAPFLDLIAQFPEEAGAQGQMRPVGGFAYLLTPPNGLSSLISGDAGNWPVLHAVLYLLIFILLCIGLGKIWVEVSGLAPRDIAGQIIDSKMQIDGFRRSDKVIEKILKRYIPTLTILNGIIVGVLSFGADFLGALGSGTGLLLMVGIMQNYAESISKEAAAEQYPALRGFLGLT
ncbi:MAG: preprotein translocase subunit SecY [Candidatus Lokiarchaeota archaeon]|nr:preprotein translocase subunit SecY [Candidatus Lokiarchaeota archaeon]